MPVRQQLRVEVPNGFDASVVLNLPNGFDINANKKYPILVYSYGGPGNHTQAYAPFKYSKVTSFYSTTFYLLMFFILN